MIDSGLLISIAAVVGTVWVLARLMQPRTMAATDVVDSALTGVVAGIVTARVVAMAFENPAGLSRLGEVMLLRSGLDFWPGVITGIVTLAFLGRRAGVAVGPRLADWAPFGLCAYAAYEATCLARDGCFGPRSPIGLRPAGIGSRQFPVGLAVAAAVVVLAMVVRWLAAGSAHPTLLLAVGGLAAIRFLAAFWLPRVTLGPTRQQTESLLVLVFTGAATVVLASSLRRTLARHGDGSG
jgi:hypothetical protein